MTQGFNLADARLMIASALEDFGQALLEEGKPLPVPSTDAQSPDADLIELVPLSVHAGTSEVKRHQLINHLHRHGCTLSREGGRHSTSRTRRRVTKLPCRGTPKSTTGSLGRSASSLGSHHCADDAA